MKATTRLNAALVVALLGGAAAATAQNYGAYYPYVAPYAGNSYAPYGGYAYDYASGTLPQGYAQGSGYDATTGTQSYGAYSAAPGYAADPYAYGGGRQAYGNTGSGYGYYGVGQGYSGYYPSTAQSPYAYYPPLPPKKRSWKNWDWSDLLKKDNGPLQDPLQHEGYWADPNFHPWRTGPFAYRKWKDHPMKNFPWGDFPGWGEGFFGNFGPDQWKGVTPWGNDVPFKWIDPSDPEESIAEMWEDALNTPNSMGRLPPGFTMPYISVPNPIDVENEFERNARNSPNEFRNMWSDQGATMGAAPKRNNEKQEGAKAKGSAKPQEPSQGGQSSPSQSTGNK
ncbi:MAG: hypothetical protein D6720_04360 [Gammaproteobacteria bacterium]|nr:MAG: hypothetical protein D6720_04360 [Gammaproteobacteria bacterium]